MNLDIIKQVLQNPSRVLYRFRDQFFRRRNIDSLVDYPIRYFPPKRKTPKIFMAITRYDYGDVSRGISFEENNFLHSLVQSGYEVVTFDTLGTAKKYGVNMMNDLLIENVYRWSPDLVVCFLFRDEIKINTLNRLTNTVGIPTLNWFADDHWRFDTFSKLYAPHFSYIVTTDKDALHRYSDLGLKNVLHSQWGCNHYLYRRLHLIQDTDVTFVGQPHGDRRDVVKQIAREGVSIQTFGFGWPSGRVSTFQMIELFNKTKVNLNLSKSSRGHRDQIKGRDFEIPGCGGFMLRTANSQLGEYFELGKELVTYDKISDLIDKIRYYLEHQDERDAIRNAAYKRVLRDHTYESRFEKIFQQVLRK
jgi:spore maturation protein CgeB